MKTYQLSFNVEIDVDIDYDDPTQAEIFETAIRKYIMFIHGGAEKDMSIRITNDKIKERE